MPIDAGDCLTRSVPVLPSLGRQGSGDREHSQWGQGWGSRCACGEQLKGPWAVYWGAVPCEHRGNGVLTAREIRTESETGASGVLEIAG